MKDIYVGKCPGCGVIVAGTSIRLNTKQQVVLDLAEFVKDGLIIETLDGADVREFLGFCTCGQYHNTETITDEERELAKAMLTADQMISGKGQALEIKDVIENFALITYDIPSTPEGNKARTELCERAKWCGAVQFTESVYIVPWGNIIDLEVLKAADIGKVYVWNSVPKDADLAKQITIDYDNKIRKVFKECEDRLESMAKHVEDQKWGIAHRMFEKTIEQADCLKKIAITRGSTHLYERWDEMNKKIDSWRLLFTASGKY